MRCTTRSLIVSAALAGLCAGLSAVPAAAAEARPLQRTCVLIDTDLDFDDLMSIPAVIATRHVVGIVTTEGVSLPGPAASALKKMLVQPGTGRTIPVVVGASYPGQKDLSSLPWLPSVRTAMERANDMLSGTLTPSPLTAASRAGLPAVVRKLVAPCTKLDVLILGTYTSFTKYSPALRPTITRVVSSGRPLSEYQGSQGSGLSFNCEYDYQACSRAYAQLRSFTRVWVDISHAAPDDYKPSLDMVTALTDSGMPGSLKLALLSDLTTWEPTSLATGGKSFLWDQSAALFLLHPGAYSPVSEHMTPSIPPAEVRRLWTAAVNQWTPSDGS